ncbi:alpha-glucan family phosphorylase, partial [bacterium]
MANRKIYVHPRYPEPLTKLFELSMNIWSFWNPEVQNLFRVANGKLFEKCGRNPLRFLNDLPEERRTELAADPGYLEQLEDVYDRFKEHTIPVKEEAVAYFSMEFGLHLLPIYAGGLGMLAGDILKGASDMAMPVVGVGLYYRYGYFRQNINIDGEQEEFYNEAELPYLPLSQFKDREGKSLYIDLKINGKNIKIRVWEVLVGRLRLLLLDTNVPENSPDLRTITDYLYVADRDKRILQEIILGRGGYLALEAAGISPQVYHLNEGHSAFLIIERFKRLVTSRGFSVEEARNLIKATTVFTTHTPVEAGNEHFPAEMIRVLLKEDIESIGIPCDMFLKDGFLHDDMIFWMPALALRYSSHANGVSKIHASVSRAIWKSIYTHIKEEEIPIVPITNGVHSSWMAPDLRDLIRNHTGQDIFTAEPSEGLRDAIYELPDAELWDIHMRHKRRMISSLRTMVMEKGLAKGFSSGTVQKARAKLNTSFLTIVFARRFAPYKRP